MMAAYQGDAAAAFNMGQMYSAGEGIEQNTEKAIYWIKLAAGKNYLPAVEMVASAYRNGGFGLPIDADQAKNWESKLPALRLAAKKDYDKKMATMKTEYKASMKADIAKKAASKKASDETAAKKVDDADEETATKAAK
jgi:TPR repeat protein